jgi:AraC-like DNA-binding protein
MSGKINWDMSLINKLRYSLTAKNPIRLLTAEYLENQGSLLDMHYEIEFGLVLSGRMTRVYRNWRTDVTAGHVWSCGIWEPHGFSVKETPCRALVIILLPQMLVSARFAEAPEFSFMNYFTPHPSKRPNTGKLQEKEVLAIGKKITALQHENDPLVSLRLKTFFFELLLLLQKDIIPNEKHEALPDTAYDAVRKAVETVFERKNLVTEIEIAKESGMNRNSFNRIFGQITGMSFAKFALKYRLGNVASMLLQTDEPVKSLAAEWGFTDASHLYKLFRRHYGCLPLQYRNRHKTGFMASQKQF